MIEIKKLLLTGLWLSVLYPATSMATTDDLTQYVNPLIGTGAIDNDSYMGCTFPGATVPFGMVQLSPDTQFYPHGLMPSGYDYNHSRIYGFTHTHLSGTEPSTCSTFSSCRRHAAWTTYAVPTTTTCHFATATRKHRQDIMKWNSTLPESRQN